MNCPIHVKVVEVSHRSNRPKSPELPYCICNINMKKPNYYTPLISCYFLSYAVILRFVTFPCVSLSACGNTTIYMLHAMFDIEYVTRIYN